jgi:phosphate-selective porin OprO/OprP
VGRVPGIDFDEATFPTFANPAQAVQSASGFTAGLNWHLNRAVKILVNYEQTNFTAPAGGTERPTEKVLVSRLQFAI